MKEAEAKTLAIRETKYCYVLACAWEGDEKDSICLERIFTKKHKCEEIRLAWWKDGRLVTRPADIDAVNWIALFQNAIRQGVFTSEERQGMLKALR